MTIFENRKVDDGHGVEEMVLSIFSVMGKKSNPHYENIEMLVDIEIAN